MSQYGRRTVIDLLRNAVGELLAAESLLREHNQNVDNERPSGDYSARHFAVAHVAYALGVLDIVFNYAQMISPGPYVCGSVADRLHNFRGVSIPHLISARDGLLKTWFEYGRELRALVNTATSDIKASRAGFDGALLLLEQSELTAVPMRRL